MLSTVIVRLIILQLYLTWIIADINYWLGTGDTACTTPHAVVVPKTVLGTGKMNDTATTAGGIAGSKGSTQYGVVAAAFPGSILEHREYSTNAVTNGIPSGGAWTNSTNIYMNENMVYGSKMVSSMSNGQTDSYNGITIDTTQLALFALNREHIIAYDSSGQRAMYWLRDISSDKGFAVVGLDGFSVRALANNQAGIRPVFGITG